MVDCIKKRDTDIESTFCHRFSSKEVLVSVPTMSSCDVRYITDLDTCVLGHTIVKKCSSKPTYNKIGSVVTVEIQLVAAA